MNWKKAVKQRPKKLVSLFALAGLIAGGWYWYASAARQPEQNAQQPITVTRGTIQEVVNAICSGPPGAALKSAHTPGARPRAST